jgi:hypothetical protein
MNGGDTSDACPLWLDSDVECVQRVHLRPRSDHRKWVLNDALVLAPATAGARDRGSAPPFERNSASNLETVARRSEGCKTP